MTLDHGISVRYEVLEYSLSLTSLISYPLSTAGIVDVWF